MSKKKTDELKQKLEETEDTPNILDMVSILPPPKVLDTQTLWRSPKEKETT